MKDSTKKALIILIVCVVLVVVIGIISAVAATRTDEDRLEYELSGDGTYYIVTKVKNTYRGGVFCKDTLTVPSTHDGLPVKEIKKLITQDTKEIIISEGITLISDSAFYDPDGNETLEKVVLPESLTTISLNSFKSCFALRDINIPINVNSIGEGVFMNCESLTNVDIAKGSAYEFYEGILYKTYVDGKDIISIAHAKGDIELAVGLSEIADEAFDFQTELISLVIADGVVTIGDSAFSNCSALTTITIPATVTEIGAGAFDKCKSLTTIYFNGTTEQWNAIKKGKKWWNSNNNKNGKLSIVCTDSTIEV